MLDVLHLAVWVFHFLPGSLILPVYERYLQLQPPSMCFLRSQRVCKLRGLGQSLSWAEQTRSGSSSQGMAVGVRLC